MSTVDKPREYSPGQIIEESTRFPDPATGRETVQLTTTGKYNHTPTYHYTAAFTADSRYILISKHYEDGRSLLLKGEMETGRLIVIDAADGDPGLSAMGSAVEPNTNRALVKVGQSVCMYDLDTFEKREVFLNTQEGTRVAGAALTCDGKRAILDLCPVLPPDVQAACKTVYDQFQALVERFGGCPATYIEVDVQTGRRQEVFKEEVAGNNHIQPCPVEADLWLIDRDLPPLFSHGGDNNKSSRCWLYHRGTGALTEIRPRSQARWQVHCNWNHDGTRVYYHGPSHTSLRPTYGEFIGVADTSGNVIWEQLLPGAGYGHVSTHSQAEAIITDGTYTADHIVAVHYEGYEPDKPPHLEILARHNTARKVAPGQHSHPHCHMSPDGRWLSYNKGQPDGRADVCVVRLS